MLTLSFCAAEYGDAGTEKNLGLTSSSGSFTCAAFASLCTSSDLKPVFSHYDPLLFSEENLAYDPPEINIYEIEDEEMPARFASFEDDNDDEDEEDEEPDDKNANYNRYFLRQ